MWNLSQNCKKTKSAKVNTEKERSGCDSYSLSKFSVIIGKKISKIGCINIKLNSYGSNWINQLGSMKIKKKLLEKTLEKLWIIKKVNGKTGWKSFLKEVSNFNLTCKNNYSLSQYGYYFHKISWKQIKWGCFFRNYFNPFCLRNEFVFLRPTYPYDNW